MRGDIVSGAMQHSSGQVERCPTPSVITAWMATGNPALDLASWTRESDATFAIASRSIQCDDLEGDALREATQIAFLEVLRELPQSPCRVWSFLPRPNDPDLDSIDRYMRFNMGRTSAYRAMGEQLRAIPAGTCVGHFGSNLVVHALWTDGPILAVENPRQCPAWQYSTRYGPVPPAFTRAMRTSTLLMASGTAAVVGEDSVHSDALELQFEESVRNLTALSDAARVTSDWRSLHIYVRESAHLEHVRALAQAQFGGRVEKIFHAPICRRELLVEIEGVCDVH